jgi:four helix bundle protein
MSYRFEHENLDCYKLAVTTARWVCKTPWPRGLSDLKNQARRAAATSVCLNLAEGCARGGRAGINHLRIANASAAETAAALDTAFGDGASAQIEQMRRISIMVIGLIKRLE